MCSSARQSSPCLALHVALSDRRALAFGHRPGGDALLPVARLVQPLPSAARCRGFILAWQVGIPVSHGDLRRFCAESFTHARLTVAGPIPHPFTGTVDVSGVKTLNQIYAELSEKHGRFFMAWLGVKPVFVIQGAPPACQGPSSLCAIAPVTRYRQQQSWYHACTR